MKLCRICLEELNEQEKFRGTCDKCEKAISTFVSGKMMYQYSYPTKFKLMTQKKKAHF